MQAKATQITIPVCRFPGGILPESTDRADGALFYLAPCQHVTDYRLWKQRCVDAALGDIPHFARSGATWRYSSRRRSRAVNSDFEYAYPRRQAAHRNESPRATLRSRVNCWRRHENYFITLSNCVRHSLLESLRLFSLSFAVVGLNHGNARIFLARRRDRISSTWSADVQVFEPRDAERAEPDAVKLGGARRRRILSLITRRCV